MRIVLIFIAFVLSALAAGSARASIGYSCSAMDANLRLAIAGAYSTSIGGGIANFGGDIEVLRPIVPERLRRIWFDLDHLGQNWFLGREIKFVTRWRAPDEEPFAEVVLIVETRRGEAEESPYVGTYELMIEAASSEDRPDALSLQLHGRVECEIG